MTTIFRAIVVLLPWFIRRRVLVACYGYEIHSSARIGLAWVYPKSLIMGPGTHIGHLTVCINLSEVRLEESASIGRGNWVTGFPAGHSRHFAHQPDRLARLHLKRHSAITNRHIIDCTAEVVIGEFSTIAGFRSQILTHSIDVMASRQSAHPVRVGARCFIGTNCVILGGAELPDHSVLGASSLLNKTHVATHTLYGGVPARALKQLPPEALYFTRPCGYVD